MNRILILSNAPSDLSDLIQRSCPEAEMYALSGSADAYEKIPIESFDAFCILAGNEEAPFRIAPALRVRLEKMRAAGKPCFFEYIASVGGCYMESEKVMTHHRLAYLGDNETELADGDILDGHYNNSINYVFVPQGIKPVLTWHPYLCAHDHVEMSAEEIVKGRWALFYPDKNTLIAGMRLCNFHRARFAPEKRWQIVITKILSWLAGEKVNPVFEKPVCRFEKDTRIDCAAQAQQTVTRGLKWYHNADMLVEGGAAGVREGLSHHVYAKNGKQMRAEQIRTDCTAETGGAFLMDDILRKNSKSREIYEKTKDFCFQYMQVKEGMHRGMLRWSETAWQTCYQDDAARVILPSLLEANYAGGTTYFPEILEALDYMVKTTGKNGLRRPRTDIPELDEKKMAALREEECGMTSAHYNGFYHAVLLLAYRAGGKAEYLDVAQKGLTSIMSCYPQNIRETSETEENCRLILPLAVLYQITGKEEHRKWLYQVTENLLKVQHKCGAFMEWDTGYQACCSRREAGECALLAENGDPVADMLYSVNWLPLGFAYAWLATKDEMFYRLWCDIASYFVSCQIYSDDRMLDGAWTRAFDLERWEIYGVPHDVGWAPCCIESGWTVGEILMGLQFMELAEKIVAQEKNMI